MNLNIGRILIVVLALGLFGVVAGYAYEQLVVHNTGTITASPHLELNASSIAWGSLVPDTVTQRFLSVKNVGDKTGTVTASIANLSPSSVISVQIGLADAVLDPMESTVATISVTVAASIPAEVSGFSFDAVLEI